MADVRPPLVAELVWSGDLHFDASSGTSSAIVDGDGQRGPHRCSTRPSGLRAAWPPMSLTSSEGAPSVHALGSKLTAQRAPLEPHRVLSVALHLTIAGPVPAEAIHRAIALSREKYCSVWHSLRQDIALTTTFHVSP
jgi:putative redox protein